MDKEQLSKQILHWMKDFLIKKFSNDYDLLDVLIPESNLSKLPILHIKSIPNYSSWEFKPDLIGILKNKITGEVSLAIANRTTSSISLKEIGELHTYAKVLDAKFAILISTNGPSNEVNILLLEQSISDRLLKFNNKTSLLIATWDIGKKAISQESILPLDYRNKFNV
jgi:hypothetical protein